MKTQLFICDVCNFDKFHVCKEENNIFIACAHCGMRTNIDIKNYEDLKIIGDNK